MAQHLLADLIRQSGSVVIDGAMSTALEKAGCDLNDKLWSARVLIEEPGKIRQVIISKREQTLPLPQATKRPRLDSKSAELTLRKHMGLSLNL